MADKACSAKSREKMFSNWSFAFQKKTWIVKTFIQKPISNKYENYHVCSELGGEIAWESLSICSNLSKTKLIWRFELSIQLINSSTFLSLASRDLSLKRKTKVETLTILPHSPSSPWGKGKQTFSLQLSFFTFFPLLTKKFCCQNPTENENIWERQRVFPTFSINLWPTTHKKEQRWTLFY